MKKLYLLTVIGFAVISISACTTVPSGMGAIEWTPSGGTLKEPIGEGEQIVSPFSDIFKYDLREQEHQESLDVLANNGLAITLDTSILFKPVSSELYLLQTEIGPDYYRILLGPLLRSGARKVVGRYAPEEIYSTKREEIEREIFAEVNRKLQSRHIQVDGILIRDVHLPKIVQEAIELKLQQEQRALAMQFVLAEMLQQYAAMAMHDAFGNAGGAGGIEYVERMIERDPHKSWHPRRARAVGGYPFQGAGQV